MISNVGVEFGLLSMLIGLLFLEIYGCVFIVLFDKFKIFLIENEFLFGENLLMLGGEYVIFFVVIMGFI